MDDAEVAEIRKKGVLDVALEGELMDLDILMAVARDIFPNGHLMMTLHSNKKGVRILNVAST